MNTPLRETLRLCMKRLETLWSKLLIVFVQLCLGLLPDPAPAVEDEPPRELVTNPEKETLTVLSPDLTETKGSIGNSEVCHPAHLPVEDRFASTTLTADVNVVRVASTGTPHDHLMVRVSHHDLSLRAGVPVMEGGLLRHLDDEKNLTRPLQHLQLLTRAGHLTTKLRYNKFVMTSRKEDALVGTRVNTYTW